MNFFETLTTAIASRNSLLIVGLDPNPEMLMPRERAQPITAAFLQEAREWLSWVIAATVDHVCAYKPTLGFYQSLGPAGLALLLELRSMIPAEIPLILDAKHSDLNSSSAVARVVFGEWGCDAISLSPFAGQDLAAPFLLYPDKGIFVLCHTSNPAARSLQEFPSSELPLYLQVVSEAQRWGTPEQVFLEVGTANPEVLNRIRQAAPERFILLRSLWGEATALDRLLQAGLTAAGDGLLIPVPQDLLTQANLDTNTEDLRALINHQRATAIDYNSSCQLWLPEANPDTTHPHQLLILNLFDIGCLLFGEYVQASGAIFNYYIDLRQIISNPNLFHQVLHAYAEILETLQFDRIAGIPYGSLPTATGLSLLMHFPLIYPRKEVKAHGARRLIEGDFALNETVVVVDDVLITGKSVLEGIEKLETSGLRVRDVVVFIDHGGGVKERLQAKGYTAHAVLDITEITETLYRAGRITDQQYQTLKQAESPTAPPQPAPKGAE
jgi:uridine monophosphate synthetase